MNDYKGYSLFNDVKNQKIQDWNRYMVFFNVIRDKGVDEGKKYLGHFDKNAVLRVTALHKRIVAGETLQQLRKELYA